MVKSIVDTTCEPVCFAVDMRVASVADVLDKPGVMAGSGEGREGKVNWLCKEPRKAADDTDNTMVGCSFDASSGRRSSSGSSTSKVCGKHHQT